jgi:hypothetical protein
MLFTSILAGDTFTTAVNENTNADSITDGKLRNG